MKRSSDISLPEKFKNVSSGHPQVLVHPVKHGATKFINERVGRATFVSHVEVAFQEGGQEV